MITALFTNFKYATVRISKFVFFLEFMKDSLTFIWSFVPLKISLKHGAWVSYWLVSVKSRFSKLLVRKLY